MDLQTFQENLKMVMFILEIESTMSSRWKSLYVNEKDKSPEERFGGYLEKWNGKPTKYFKDDDIKAAQKYYHINQNTYNKFFKLPTRNRLKMFNEIEDWLRYLLISRMLGKISHQEYLKWVDVL